MPDEPLGAPVVVDDQLGKIMDEIWDNRHQRPVQARARSRDRKVGEHDEGRHPDSARQPRRLLAKGVIDEEEFSIAKAKVLNLPFAPVKMRRRCLVAAGAAAVSSTMEAMRRECERSAARDGRGGGVDRDHHAQAKPRGAQPAQRVRLRVLRGKRRRARARTGRRRRRPSAAAAAACAGPAWRAP